jgi:Viral BACON domain/Putative binding domain, N-terminal
MGDGHRPVRFLHAFISFFSALLCIGVLYPPISEADAMPVPSSGPQVFISCAAVLPSLNADPSLANPIGVGTVAVGGNIFDLKIGLDPFDVPVDIYLALKANSGDAARQLNDYPYYITRDNQLHTEFAAWKTNVTDVDEDVTGNVPVSSLPLGTYTLYLLVVPSGAVSAGDLNNYYLWQTPFSTATPFIFPSCIDFGEATSSTQAASIAIVNTCGENVSYNQPQAGSAQSAGDFTISNDPAGSCTTLQPGGWCPMNVTFTPTGTGKKQALMTIPFKDNAGNEIDIPIVVHGVSSSAVACVSGLVPPGVSNFSSAGGSSSFSVTASSGCSWTATSSDSSWLQLTTTSGAGNGTVYYEVTQNTGTSSRTGTITVGGQTFTVTQAAASNNNTACTSPTVSPTTFSPGAAGGTYSINVSTSAGCTWNADVSLFSAAWINVTSGRTYTGSGTVKFSVAASSGNRTGYLTVDGKSITVTQQGSGCSYSVSPGTQTLGTSASTGSLTVTAGANCPWTIVSSDTSWLTITSSSSGTGNGNVSYSVAADTANVKRTASIFVEQSPGTASLAVTQDPGSSGCNYSLSAYSKSFDVSGGSGSFNVTTGSGCNWTATSNSTTWLHITSGSTVSSSGTVSYTVDANTGSARTGTITAAGQTFTVSEAGTAPSPTSGAISYSSLPINDPKGWTYSGNAVGQISFYAGAMPAGDKTLQVNVSGEVPKAWNNDMLISDTDFGSQSNAVSLYKYFLAIYGYNAGGPAGTEYPAGSGAHYWGNFVSSSESETVTIPAAAGTYYIMVINADPYDSLFGIIGTAW